MAIIIQILILWKTYAARPRIIETDWISLWWLIIIWLIGGLLWWLLVFFWEKKHKDESSIFLKHLVEKSKEYLEQQKYFNDVEVQSS